MAEPGQPQRVVYLHIGAPKTGTTYLQRLLWDNREALARDGLCYAAADPDEHFRAAVDLRDLRWGGQPRPEYAGTWAEVARRVGEWPGRSVVSNELLAGADSEQVQRAHESLAGAEVHVVYTLRDLARMLCSDWQEQVKHRHALPLERYLADVLDAGEASEVGSWFWGLHDGPAVLARWAAAVPPQRVHLVTGPPSTAPADVLWRRFAGVLGVDPAAYDLPERPVNESLGRVQAELLQRVNARVAGSALEGRYGQVVGAVLVERVLRERTDPLPVRLPPERVPQVRRRAEEAVGALAAAGYDVVGDLAELLPVDQPAGAQPAYASVEAVLDVAADTLTGVLEGLAELTEEEPSDPLAQEPAEPAAPPGQSAAEASPAEQPATAGPSHRLRQALGRLRRQP